MQGSEPDNKIMSQLESHEILLLSGLKVEMLKDFSTDLLVINQNSVNESLPCTLRDISPIVFHSSVV